MASSSLQPGVSPVQNGLLRADVEALRRRARAAVLLRGPLDVERWSAAIMAVAEEQEILRTRILWMDGAHVQAVAERAEVEVLRGGDPGWGGLEGRGEDGGVLRTALTPTAGGCLWRLSVPALTADRRGLLNLVAAVGRRYGGLLESRPQYLDVSRWQQDLLASDQTAFGRRFWQERRRELGEPLRLQAAAGSERRAGCRLAGDKWRRLCSLAAQWGCHRESILLTGWQALAARRAESPLAPRWLGVCREGRKYEPLGEALGPFAKDLPLAATLVPGQSFRDRVVALEAELAEAERWEEYLAPAEWCSGLVLEYETEPAGWNFGYLEAELVALEVQRGGAAVQVRCVERSDGLEVVLESEREGVWSEVLAQWEELLASALASPEAEVSRLSLLPAAQRSSLLAMGAGRTATWLGGGNVLELFEGWARELGELPAASDDERSWTYGELNARAGRLAGYLRRLGVGRESVVGIHARRGLESLTAVLGVLKAGGAYLPLSVSDPPARLAGLLAESQARVVLSTGGLGEGLPDIKPDIQMIDLGEPSPWRDEAVVWGGGGLWAQQAAYVIYTSGSTGRPKGVVVTHGGLSNYVRWAQSAYGVVSGEGSLVHTPLSFDLTVTSLLVPLASGGWVRLMAEGEGIEGLRAQLAGGGAGLVKLTPSHLRALSAAGSEPLSCRALAIGGEALRYEHLRDWRAGGTRLFNEYGPSETVVGCSVWEVGAGEPESGEVPIGRALSNVRLYVVDGWGELVPAGVAGELWVGGAGVARGYLGQPGSTAERFVPDGLSGASGERLYRTGDRVRWRGEGVLEYMGRLDDQVKVRGHRIELGEIESALGSLPGVREAVVVAREDRPGEVRLVGYVVGEGTEESWRRDLRSRLPEVMVPSALVRLERLPLTANGKVDRRSLPAPESGAAWEAPRTAAEEVLASIWSEVLGCGQVGRHDNFFALGGDSILSIQVVARAHPRGLRLTPRQMFDHPTVAALAAIADSADIADGAVPDAGSAGGPPDLSALGPDAEDVYPLTPLQAGLLFHVLIEPQSNAYYTHLHCRIDGELDAERLRQAWEGLMERHGALRTSFVWEGVREPLQVVRRGVELPWRVEDWRGFSADEQRRRWQRLVAVDREQGHQPDRAPLFRLYLVRVAADRHWFLWSHHHLILDGWSMAVLVRELLAGYEAAGRGERVRREPAEPFRRYLEWLQRQDHEAAEGYWRRQLARVEPLVVAASQPLSILQSGGRHVKDRVELDEEVSLQLAGFARRCQVTLNTVVQGAWALVLGLCTGRSEVVFGATVAGRPSALAGVEEMVGMFINTLPVRVRMPAAADLTAWLHGLQREAAEARDYEYAPLSDVRRWSGLPADQVLFDSLLVFENLPPAAPARPGGLAITEMTTATDNNYPLNLVIVPGERLVIEVFRLPELQARSASLVAELVAVLRRIADPSAGERRTLDELMAPGPEAGEDAASELEETFQFEI